MEPTEPHPPPPDDLPLWRRARRVVTSALLAAEHPAHDTVSQALQVLEDRGMLTDPEEAERIRAEAAPAVVYELRHSTETAAEAGLYATRQAARRAGETLVRAEIPRTRVTWVSEDGLHDAPEEACSIDPDGDVVPTGYLVARRYTTGGPPPAPAEAYPGELDALRALRDSVREALDRADTERAARRLAGLLAEDGGDAS